MDFDVSDRLQIHELVALHGHLMDAGRLDDADLAQLFTADVRYDVSALGGTVLVGVAAIREASLLLGSGNPVAHLVTNIVVQPEDDGDSAIVCSKGIGCVTGRPGGQRDLSGSGHQDRRRLAHLQPSGDSSQGAAHAVSRGSPSAVGHLQRSAAFTGRPPSPEALRRQCLHDEIGEPLSDRAGLASGVGGDLDGLDLGRQVVGGDGVPRGEDLGDVPGHDGDQLAGRDDVRDGGEVAELQVDPAFQAESLQEPDRPAVARRAADLDEVFGGEVLVLEAFLAQPWMVRRGESHVVDGHERDAGPGSLREAVRW
jgi:hypothetical protein